MFSDFIFVLCIFELSVLCTGHMHLRGFRSRDIYLPPVTTEISVWYPQTWPIHNFQLTGPTTTWTVPNVPDGNGVPHFHRLLNGDLFQHSHPFGDHSHIHDLNGEPVFPGFHGKPYAGTGMQWQIPKNMRDLNTWAVVNPDSIITADDQKPKLPEVSDIFPGDIDLSSDVLPDPASFPTSDKKMDTSSDVKPLEPIVPGGKTGKNDTLQIIITQISTTKKPLSQTTASPLKPQVKETRPTCHKT